MKRVIYLATLLLGVAYSARAQQPQTALELNDYLVAAVESISQAGSAWGSKYAEVSANAEYYLLASYRQDIISVIDSKTEAIQSFQDVGGSEEFRTALIDFLGFEKKMITQCFVPFENLTEYSTTEEIDALITALNQMAQEENSRLDNIRQIQSSYALLNGFTIEGENSDYEEDYDEYYDYDDSEEIY
jgi:hypothetical protein